MAAATWFITGSDTGVGKTVLTALLTRHLLAKGVSVRAVKPFCSGGREDAEILFAAQAGRVPLDEINPWNFRAPLAPLVAARRERKVVNLPQVVDFFRDAARRCHVLLVEGAGGLLSPLGEGFAARELIRVTRARPLVVCADRLGALNQVLLVLAALPPPAARQARVVLMPVVTPDESSASNGAILAELLGRHRVHRLPYWPGPVLSGLFHGPLPAGLKTRLTRLLAD